MLVWLPHHTVAVGGSTANRASEKLAMGGSRTVMIELAWLWTRYQPGAAQVCWFRERVGSTGRRVRKVMVVALGGVAGLVGIEVA